ncbi:MAG: AMP-binding protein [Oscillospiraceae bacterium]|nr:AMP-binding protein [Oscillospiraceae bacterium]
MNEFYRDYLNEERDEDGNVRRLTFRVPDDFNYAYDVVDRIAREEPDRRALLWVGSDFSERLYTFADVSRESDRAAAALRGAGVGRGDRVLLILKRHPEAWFCILACHKLGAVAIPATNMLGAHDILYRLRAADIRAVVCTPDENVPDRVDEAEREYGRPLIKFCAHRDWPGWRNLNAAMAAAPAFAPLSPRNSVRDPMLIYFSSGTTGMPKMVEHNFAYAVAHIPTALYWQKVVPDGLHMTVAESGWGKFVWGKLYGQWFLGAGVFAYDFDRFHAATMLSLLQKYRITTFCAPPTIYRFFIMEDLSAYDLSSITHATIAGEALNPEVLEQFHAATGLTIHEGFGMTETTCTIMNPWWVTPRPGSMGKPSPAYTVTLLDEAGREVIPGVTGEIAVKLPPEGGFQPGLFNGYCGDPEKTAEACRDGWFHTGDTAWKDEDGFFWFVGRGDDLIKSSGYRIGPFEVESVLIEHPAVLECAVTPYPDPTRGLAVKATILLAPGYTPGDELKKEIQVYVKTHTAPYKYPRVVEFVDALPKTISGKVSHAAIRDADFKRYYAEHPEEK